MDHHRERELLERWAAGDAKAGNTVLRHHMPTLERFFINKVHESDVTDLISITMMACVQSVKKFRGESSFKSFLLGIARYKLLKHYEKHGRKQAPVDPLGDRVSELIDATKVSSMLARRREHERVIEVLRELPIDLQTLVELIYWEGLTMDECAEVLGISRAKVCHGLADAKRAMRAAVQAGRGSPSEKESISQKISEWIAGIHERLDVDAQTRLRRALAIESAVEPLES